MGYGRISMGICTALLVISAIFFFVGMHIAPGQPDYRILHPDEVVEETCIGNDDAESSLLPASAQSL